MYTMTQNVAYNDPFSSSSVIQKCVDEHHMIACQVAARDAHAQMVFCPLGGSSPHESRAQSGLNIHLVLFPGDRAWQGASQEAATL